MQDQGNDLMFHTDAFSRAAEDIIQAGRFLYQQGWSPATSSNYSCRLDSHHAAITVSGRHKGQLSPEDIMVVDPQGNPVASTQRPSAETLLHTRLYQMWPHLGAVLHTHSVAATVIGRLTEGSSLELSGYELQKAFPGQDTHDSTLSLPIFDNTQDIPALAETANAWLRDHPECPGYLIRGHGLYTWGQTMKDCLRHIEALEFLLTCELETMRIRG